ncbi:MAG: hypothetical protein LBK06_04145, partial [Planctomycetaceae bacterium]|nr:hypothetical protein [Planctomycetaceae bacterium]
MSAISFSNTYISSTYYASAKSQRVESTETSNNSNNDVASQAGDVLTISAEALAALNNNGEVLTISAKELEEVGKIQIEDWKRPAKIKNSINFQLITEYLKEVTTEHSNHRSLTDWAFSIASKKEYNEITTYKYDTITTNMHKTDAKFGYNCKTVPELTHSRWQSSLENADEIFSELLKKNDIKLNEKEHIELTIDYDGKITVSGNVSKEKSDLIQNALNNDKSLGQNLLMTHTPLDSYITAKRIPVNIILQQEYGLSLEDFELNEDYEPMEYIKSKPAGYISDEELENYYEPYKPYESLKIKNGNDALLEELYNSERSLFNGISQLLREQKNNPDAVIPSTTFSYQNGVFVEKGRSDAATLKSFASNAVKTFEVFGDKIDYSITFNSNGEIIDVTDDTLPNYNLSKSLRDSVKSFKDIISDYNKDSLNGNTWDPNGKDFNAQELQQYAFEKKRLTQYETGANADDLDTFTIGKNEKGNFSIASNSKLLREITKSATENPAEKIVVRRFF